MARYETNRRKRDAAIMRLRSAYSMAASFGFTHAQLLEEIGKARAPLAKSPAWVTSFFDGYSKALMDSSYERFLIFGGYVAGRFYSVHSKRPDYYGRHGIEPSAWADDGYATDKGHYWETSHAGMKPFFISRPMQRKED